MNSPVAIQIGDMWTRGVWVRVRQQVAEPVRNAALATIPDFMHHVEDQLQNAIEKLIAETNT